MPFSDYIDKYGDFNIQNENGETQYKGRLIEKKNNIEVELVINSDEVKNIYNKELYITGRVFSTNIALFNCIFSKCISNYFGQIDEKSTEETSYVTLIPTEIILGYPDGVDPQTINGISANMNQLCCFARFKDPSETGNPIGTDIVPLFSTNNDAEKINIYGFNSTTLTRYKTTISNLVKVSFYFYKPTSPENGLHHISSLRNLFTFFTDYYLDIADFRLSYNDSEDQLAYYHINYKEKQVLKYEPGLLGTDYIWCHLKEIYIKWKHFSETNKPLVWLYYQILCNHSNGVNSFLNQCQALESYSSRTHARNATAKKLYKEEMRKQNKQANKTTLSFRLYDIILLLQYPFQFKQNQWFIIADRIAKVRNYYTHFSSTSEPSFIEITAFTRFTRLLLIGVVYRELGISQRIIHSLVNLVHFANIKELLEMVLDNLPSEDSSQ